MKYILLGGLMSVFGCWVFSQATPYIYEKDLLIHQAQQFPDGVQFSVAIVDADTTVFLGFKKENGQVLPVENQHHHFEIGSLTKVFTSTALAYTHLKQEELLDKALSNILPFKLNEKTKLTFKQLANHTAGLPRLSPDLMFEVMMNPKSPYQSYDKTKLENYLKNELALERQPQEKFEYSNTGYGILAYALEVVWNKSFDSILYESVLAPFHLLETTYDLQRVKNSLVKGVDANGFEVENWDFNAMWGAGGLYSTTQDLAKFGKLLIQGKTDYLTLTQQRTFSIQGDLSIGLGWHIIQDNEQSSPIYWHNGGTGGYTSSFAFDDGKAVILLTNSSALTKESRQIDALCFQLLKGPSKD